MDLGKGHECSTHGLCFYLQRDRLHCVLELPDVNNSQQCLVRISGEACSNVNDTSDGVFTIYRCTLAYDLNHDCVVNKLDYDLLMTEWLKCGNPFNPNCGTPCDPNCVDPYCQ